ncbi:MAG: hypothetical protein AABX25_02150 [Nanoarchaeota archaeon]
MDEKYHWIFVTLILIIMAAILTGCTQKSKNISNIPDGKSCDVDSDCKCFSGCACGCWNKDYVPPISDEICMCDAGCLVLPDKQNCICKDNTCQESS